MPDLGEPLSRREHDVLQAMAQGATNKEIASELVISPNTVKVHVRNIFTKMGASSRTEASTLAMEQGLLGNGHAVELAEVATVTTAEPDVVTSESVPVAIEAVTVDDGMADADSAEIPTTTPLPKSPSRTPYLLAALLGLLLIVSAAYFILRDPLPTVPNVEAEPEADRALSEPGWAETQPLTEARSGMTLTSIGPDIYQVGGTTAAGISNELFRYDTRSRTWHALAAKPTAVTNAGAAIAVGQIYIVGGDTATGATAAVEAYSPSGDVWRVVASLPQPLANAAVVSSGERIYVFGGERDGMVSNATYVYDPLDDSWRPLATLQQSRSGSATARIENDLYVVGGFDGQDELRSCERFSLDPEVGSWISCPDMLEARSNFKAVALGRKLYVVGGGSTQAVTYGEIYDVASETWKVLNVPVLDSAENWLDLGMAVVETRIYMLGGKQDDVLQDASYYYNALENRIFIPQATSGE